MSVATSTSRGAAFARCADAIVAAGQRLDRFGWAPSAGGNISAKVDDRTVAITRSGCRKGMLTPDDVIAVDRAGDPCREGDRPSAETLLHCQIYDLLPRAGAVVHGHSVPATVLTQFLPGNKIGLTGYEMIKAFEGQLTHEVTVGVPVLNNNQDMRLLQRELAPVLSDGAIGYVLRGHGAYAWGNDVAHAVANLEGLEFLLGCELELLKLRGGIAPV